MIDYSGIRLVASGDYITNALLPSSNFASEKWIRRVHRARQLSGLDERLPDGML